MLSETNNKISVLMVVYNEEKRIGTTLESLKAFDEIIVLDKHSTDATARIAEEHGAVVRQIPYNDDKYDPEYMNKMSAILDSKNTDWIMIVTSSDIIHPKLYENIQELLCKESADVIKLPYIRYSMGFSSKYSFYPNLEYKDVLIRKLCYEHHENIHVMLNYPQNAIVKELHPVDSKVGIYHLTHENLEMILERHLRYAEVEAKYFETREVGLKQAWHEILRQLWRSFRLKTYKLKEEGKAQICMLMLYRCAKYLHVYFDKDKENEIRNIYDRIRSLEYFQDNQ